MIWPGDLTTTLARVRVMASFEGNADAPDDFLRGYRDAIDVAGDEDARDLILRAQAWAWSKDRLRGFLMGHEQFARNKRCTCHCCPIHDAVDVSSKPGAH